MLSKTLLSLASVILLAVNACSSAATARPQIQVKVSSLQDHYPRLLAEAQHWKKDAYLTDVDIDSQGRGGAISVIFGSKSAEDESLFATVNVDSNEVISKLSKGEVPLVYQTPILEEDWKIDTVEAMELFLAEEDIRGLWLEFPERCSALGLRHFWVNNQFVLAWVLTISDCLEFKHTYYFYLDPVTGDRLNLSY